MKLRKAKEREKWNGLIISNSYNFLFLINFNFNSSLYILETFKKWTPRCFIPIIQERAREIWENITNKKFKIVQV